LKTKNILISSENYFRSWIIVALHSIIRDTINEYATNHQTRKNIHIQITPFLLLRFFIIVFNALQINNCASLCKWHTESSSTRTQWC